MMRILSVLAHPNGINVLVSGDLSSAFNILDTAAPATVVDAVIHLFSKLHINCTQPEWMIRPVCQFLSSKMQHYCVPSSNCRFFLTFKDYFLWIFSVPVR